MELQKKYIAGNCNSGFPVILTVVKVLFVVVCHEPTMEKKTVDTPWLGTMLEDGEVRFRNLKAGTGGEDVTCCKILQDHMIFVVFA